MPKRIPEEELAAIEDAVRRHAGSATARDIAEALPADLPHRTLQYRLKLLVDADRLVRESEGRGVKYRLPPEGGGEVLLPLSPAGMGNPELSPQATRCPEARRL